MSHSDHEDPSFEGSATRWKQMRDASQIWDTPQFSVQDVCAVTGATPKALEHFVDPKRGLVRLLGNHVNPGTGKRRLFTGGQVLMVSAAFSMNAIGFPQRWTMALAETVERRAKARAIGLSIETAMSIVTFPMRNGDWAFHAIYNETKDHPALPRAVQILDVDRLIDEVSAQLLAIISGEDIPDFTPPDPVVPPNPYSPKVNFLRAWTKDEAGHWVYVGLNWQETQDLLDHQDSRLVGDDLEIIERSEDRPDRHDRTRAEYIRELYDRHENARQDALANERGPLTNENDPDA